MAIVSKNANAITYSGILHFRPHLNEFGHSYATKKFTDVLRITLVQFANDASILTTASDTRLQYAMRMSSIILALQHITGRDKA